MAFKIEYETKDVTNFLTSEYRNPEDADKIARQLVEGGNGDVLRTTVIEQDGTVYSEWVRP